MDIPTTILLVSLIAVIACFVFAGMKKFEGRRIGFLCFGVMPIYAIVTFLGETWPGFGKTDTCYKFLGCNVGFFGYDAGEHFLFGVIAALLILWLGKRFPSLSVAARSRWKTILTVIAFVALAAVIWEMLECAYDTFSIQVLHEHLVNFRLHINLLLQSSNLDTMGDISMSLAGALLALLGVRRIDKKSLLA